jgi:hypothetical protein
VPLVAVGRAQDRQDQLPARYSRAVNLHVVARVALGRHLLGRGVTQQFLDRRLGGTLWSVIRPMGRRPEAWARRTSRPSDRSLAERPIHPAS